MNTKISSHLRKQEGAEVCQVLYGV